MQSSRNNPALGGGDYALGMVTWNLGYEALWSELKG